MEFLTNILGGGILGSLTSLFSSYFKLKEKREDNEFKLKMIEAQSKASINEINAQIEVQKTITEGEVMVEELRADTEEAKGRNSLIQKTTGNFISDETLHIMLNDKTWVGVVFKPLTYFTLLTLEASRGIIRPLLTAGFSYFCMFIFIEAMEIYTKGAIDQVMLMNEVIKPTINLLLFGASTMIGFWFADRASSRRYQKK
jgi:hypothetical protein